MNRAKMRKVVAAAAPYMPEKNLKKALGLVNNDRTRQRVEAAIRRRDGAR